MGIKNVYYVRSRKTGDAQIYNKSTHVSNFILEHKVKYLIHEGGQ